MGITIHEALYEMSYANLVLYSSAIPTLGDIKNKKTDRTIETPTSGKKEQFEGFSSFLARMKEIKENEGK